MVYVLYSLKVSGWQLAFYLYLEVTIPGHSFCLLWRPSRFNGGIAMLCAVAGCHGSYRLPVDQPHLLPPLLAPSWAAANDRGEVFECKCVTGNNDDWGKIFKCKCVTGKKDRGKIFDFKCVTRKKGRGKIFDFKCVTGMKVTARL
jgi:hypothetical protein